MTLYLIGVGLADEKDISVKGLEIVRRADKIYLESYTSILQCRGDVLEKYYDKKIIPANRVSVEQNAENIVREAKDSEVAFLVIGDPFSATTHIELLRLAKERKVEVKVIHNASVLTAIGETGLQLYKFGRTTSIPFLEDVPQLEAPYGVLKQNHYMDMHTLFLLDLKPEENRFMGIPEALSILKRIEARKQQKVVKDRMLVLGCARLGSDDALIKAGPLKEIQKIDFGKPPYCLIIPGKLHFLEEEMVKMFLS